MVVERGYALLIDYSITYKVLAIMYPVGSNARTCPLVLNTPGLPIAKLSKIMSRGPGGPRLIAK